MLLTLTDLAASSLSVQTTVKAPALSAYRHVFLAKFCASRTQNVVSLQDKVT